VTRNGGSLVTIGLVGAVLWLVVGLPWARWVPAAAILLLLPGTRLWWWPVARYDVYIETASVEVHRDEDVPFTVRLTPTGRGRVRWLRAELTLLGVPTRAVLDGQVKHAQRLPHASHGGRGDHVCTVHRLEAVDPLGLWRRRVRIHERHDRIVRVLPRERQFDRPWMTAPRTTARFTSTVVARDGAEFAALREYRPGDDTRLIHWPATARSVDDVVVVRQNVRATAGAVAVVLDRGLPADDEAGRAAFEVCVDIAYSLLRTAASAGDEARLLVAGRTVKDEHDIVEHLVQVRPIAGDGPALPGDDATAVVSCRPFRARAGYGAAVRFAVEPPGVSTGPMEPDVIRVASLEAAVTAWAAGERS
jgi:uncharacterized protein (DUF58 family)